MKYFKDSVVKSTFHLHSPLVIPQLIVTPSTLSEEEDDRKMSAVSLGLGARGLKDKDVFSKVAYLSTLSINQSLYLS